MTRNKIKIKTGSKSNALTFYILSEQQKWCPVSNSSVLSRNKFVNATIKEIAVDLISTIDSLYNIHNRGVDIYFGGLEEDFEVLTNTVSDSFADKNIKCILQRTMIAVAGKVKSGKTTLINELVRVKGDDYLFDDTTGIPSYSSSDNTTVWYEIPSIDIGIENVIAAQKSFEQLAKTGVTTFIYCLSTTKIERPEEELINYVVENYPSVRVIIALTQYLDEEGTIYAAKLSSRMNGIRVIPLLAQNMKTRQGNIDAYGLDVLEQAIFEGR